MQLAIAIFVGAILGTAGIVGGVSAMSSTPNHELNLYSYSDK
jgi:hypothetical protein